MENFMPSHSLTACRLGTECKHAYAALFALSKRFRKKVVVSERDAQSPGQRDHYFALVQNPGTLTEKETDWVERLEALYQGHAEGSQINGRISSQSMGTIGMITRQVASKAPPVSGPSVKAE
jgi:hypothetical protein